MNFRLITYTCLTVLMFSPVASLGQADPEWLEDWNEANETRPKILSVKSTIADADEPGVSLVIRGQVFLPDGVSPAAGVVVHSYHRDQDGYDFGPNDDTYTTWRLQGWVKSDADGRFEFQTIRPSTDHLAREGAHVHFTLISPDYGKQWATRLYFMNDPAVTDAQRKQSIDAGSFGGVKETNDINGVQYVDMKFRLKNKTDF